MSSRHATSDPRAFNRWWIVTTAAIAMIFGAGALNVLFNVVLGPVTEEFGWTLAEFTNGASMATVFVGLSALATGMLVARFGPRRPTIPMSIAFGVAVMLMATAGQGVWSWYALCVLLGATAGAATPVVHAAVITAWFAQRRGLALGCLAVGTALGSIIMPLVATWLSQSFGWRGVYIGIGLACLIIPTAVYAFVTRLPEGSQMVARRATESSVAGASLRILARQRHLWLLLAGILLVSTATLGLLSQIFPISTAHGYPREVAALILSSYGLSSLTFRLIVGYLLDRMSARLLAALLFGAGGVGVILLFLAPSVPFAFLGAILIGAAFGAETDLGTYTISRYFPRASYEKVVALMYFLLVEGGALGIFLVGQLYVLSGGYTVPMIVLVSLVALGIVCFLALGPYRYRLDGTPVDGPARHDGDPEPSGQRGGAVAR